MDGRGLRRLTTRLSFRPARRALLGRFTLECGDRLDDAVVSYRTAGTLDRDRRNAVLLLPWFQGTSADLLQHIGPGRLADPTREFVIAVDSFGNGLSSSPSNSARQAGWRFPRFGIGDLVDSHVRLLADVLNVPSLKAVIGISMGAMEVFEWIVRKPGFATDAVAIVGTPVTQPRDRRRLERDLARRRRTSSSRSAWAALCSLKPRTALYEWRLDRANYVRQCEAIIEHDIGRRFGGSLERAAAAARSRLLVVVSPTDEDVEPKPAVEFARLLADGDVLELDGRCGHQAPACETEVLWRKVRQFLLMPKAPCPTGRSDDDPRVS